MEAISLISIRSGTFDPEPNVVPTYLEFDHQIRARWCRNNPTRPEADSYRALSEVALRREWLTYVIGRFERGAMIPGRVWRTLTAGQLDAFLGCNRAQVGHLTIRSETPNKAPRLPLDRCGDPRRLTLH